jgi:HPt (histidine-containing phosphotransfer) domain-containing protein
LQIARHQELVESWQLELERLVAIPAEERRAHDVERLIELDHRLEATLGADAQVPKGVKADVLSKRHELLDETEKLIADIKRELGE